MYFKLTPKELEEILNELSQKPWGVVNNVIIKLSKLEKIEEETDKSDK
jgi:hypothetical protein